MIYFELSTDSVRHSVKRACISNPSTPPLSAHPLCRHTTIITGHSHLHLAPLTSGRGLFPGYSQFIYLWNSSTRCVKGHNLDSRKGGESMYKSFMCDIRNGVDPAK